MKRDTPIDAGRPRLLRRPNRPEASLARRPRSLIVPGNHGSRAANIGTVKASLQTIDAQIEAANDHPVADHTGLTTRYANLIKDHSTTQQQYEQALAVRAECRKQAAVLERAKATGLQANQRHRFKAKQRQPRPRPVRVSVSVRWMWKPRKFILYRDHRPEDGMVSKGERSGWSVRFRQTSRFSVLHSEHKWVVANFKTQLNKMLEGQKWLCMPMHSRIIHLKQKWVHSHPQPVQHLRCCPG